MKRAHFWVSQIIDHCHILPHLEDLESILKEFWISEKNKNQILSDLKIGFFGVKRKDGSHYIEHLIATVQNLKKYSPRPLQENDILIALLHDSIEDTDESFESLVHKYNLEIALWVHILSKKSFQSYHRDDFKKIQKAGKKETWKTISSWSRLKTFPHLSEELKNIWRRYEETIQKKRDSEYFERFTSKQKLSKYIKHEASKNNVSFEKESLSDFVEKIAIIKLSDRLHNVSTLPQDDESQEKILKTTILLKSLSTEICPEIWKSISTTIFEHFRKKDIPHAIRNILKK